MTKDGDAKKGPLTLTSLEIENFKRIKVALLELEQGGKLVHLRGDNEAGKSSVLDAIHGLVGGKDALPPVPINKGAKRARITGKFAPDGLVVERVITEKGTTVQVRSADGAKYSTPQAILDGWLGPLRFDPGGFITKKPAEQIEILRSAAKLNFTELDAKREALYGQRTTVNNNGKATLSRHDAIKVVPDAKRVDVAEVLERQRELLASKDRRLAMMARAESARMDVRRTEEKFQLAEADVRRAEVALDEARAKLADRQKTLDAHRALLLDARTLQSTTEEDASGCVDVQPELEAVAAQLASAESANKAVDAAEAKATLAKELEDLRAQSAALTEQIKAVDKEKADMLAAAKLPVDGLGFTDDGVTLNGLPFEQASQAKKILVAFALWLAEHPRLGVVPIPNASLLGKGALEAVARMAAEHGVQVFLEVVGDGDVGIVFEDGEVVKVDGKPVDKTGEEKAK